MKLLVVKYKDRIELYGSKCQVVEIQACHADDPECEVLAEKLIEEQLPLSWKEIYIPGRATLDHPGKIGTFYPDGLSPQEMNELDTLKTFFGAK